MKIAVVVWLLFGPLAVNAHEYRSVYSRSQVCSKQIYKEQYVRGNRFNKGYVKSWTENIDIPCNSSHGSSLKNIFIFAYNLGYLLDCL